MNKKPAKSADHAAAEQAPEQAPEAPKPLGKVPGLSPWFDSELTGAIKDSAAQIWQAGLGAFAKAQSGGTQAFDSLVKDGMSIQRKTQVAAEEKMGEVSGKLSKLSEDVQAKAGKQWDKLESIFEERVAKAMDRLGAPTATEMAALRARVAALEGAGRQAAAPRAAVKKPAVKPVVKPATQATAKPATKPSTQRPTKPTTPRAPARKTAVPRKRAV